jgi:hypothetical protein
VTCQPARIEDALALSRQAASLARAACDLTGAQTRDGQLSVAETVIFTACAIQETATAILARCQAPAATGDQLQ